MNFGGEQKKFQIAKEKLATDGWSRNSPFRTKPSLMGATKKADLITIGACDAPKWSTYGIWVTILETMVGIFVEQKNWGANGHPRPDISQ